MSAQYGSRPSDDERPLKELITDMSDELKTLVKKEVELAKVETKEQVSKAAKAGAMFGATAVCALFAAGLLSWAAAWALAEVMPTWAAFAVVGVLYALFAGVTLALGRKKLSTVRPPTQTVQTIKQDVEVAKSSLQRGASGPARDWYGSAPTSERT